MQMLSLLLYLKEWNTNLSVGEPALDTTSEFDFLSEPKQVDD